MEENLNYVAVPDFDPEQTMKDIYSDDLHRQTYGLYSLTYYSGDYNLILTTLEKFVGDENWKTRYTVFQCLSGVIRLFREIPADNFLPYLVEGFEDKNDEVKGFVCSCLQNFFYYMIPVWRYTSNDINKIVKSGQTIDIIKALLFIHHNAWTGEKLSSVIRKCLRHEKEIIQYCGGILLRLAYNNLHAQLLTFEAAAKLARKLDTNDLSYFNNEVYAMVGWIEEDMCKLKSKLQPGKKSHRL